MLAPRRQAGGCDGLQLASGVATYEAPSYSARSRGAGVWTAQQQQISPYFNPTYTRTGWIGQPPVLDRHEVVTIDGDVDTLRQATP